MKAAGDLSVRIRSVAVDAAAHPALRSPTAGRELQAAIARALSGGGPPDRHRSPLDQVAHDIAARIRAGIGAAGSASSDGERR
jgi:hypothetical protein